MEENLDDDMIERTPMNYAGFGERLGAFLIDFTIYTIISYLIWGSEVVNTTNGFQINYTGAKAFIPIAYCFIFWIALSTSPGKMALGMKIVDQHGEKINFTAVLLRSLGYIILIIGCWFILGNDKKQALHDKFAQSYVVKK
jgi:uncharacterized RDD family membrane protein YckC